ncbi:protein fem-1 homolog B-like [Lineus longissimus]|uniref:protein fem-1 homolog B-like n=1 Tax=Lineus longissimus TaxID=88925 RepID=UPI00315D3BD9
MSSLKEKTHMAARDGMAISLFALLCNRRREEVNEALSHFTLENGQNTTPLIISARNGHSKVVRMLLSNFDVDIEQVAQVKFDGYIIEEATALWCAAGGGHLDVVKILVEMRAQPNHATSSNSTPLRAACFDGRLEIVEYLLKNNADFTIANKYDNTCLMIACYKGHVKVVRALLSAGSDPNLKAHCEATALHFAAECGYVEIVKLLIQYGATLQPNNVGMTPLMTAAENCQAEVVEYFLSESEHDETDFWINAEKRIECLELMGTAFANDKDNYNIEKAYHYMWLAMVERHRDPDNVIKKSWSPPEDAYENRCECLTLSELEAIEHNAHAIHMEALIMRERILGTENPELLHPIVFRGAVFADMAQFDKCIGLWLRAMDLRFGNNRSIGKDLLRFAQVFSQMIHVGVKVDFDRILCVFDFAIKELKNHQKCSEPSSGDSQLSLEEAMEADFHTAMYLIALLCKVKHNTDQEFEMCKFIYMFNKMDLRLGHGMTPLHVASNAQIAVDDFHVCDVVRYPNASVVRLLIHCGADTNAVDKNGDSPLHIIVTYDKPISDFLTLHSIIVLLCEYGGHMDRANKKGLTPMDVCWTGVSEIILRTLKKISLKCLAARAVRQHHIDYKGHLPFSLEEFVALH